MPGADLMPSGAMETFTGSNGATPSTTNITLAFNQGSGGGITIQSNQLRIRTGTTQFNRTSVRLTGISRADGELEFDWVVPNNSNIFMQMMMRAGTTIDTGNGYLFFLEPNDMTVSRLVSYSGTTLATATHGFVAGQLVRTRVALFGQRIRARTWLVGNPEPTSTWQIDYTDPTGSGGISAAGAIGWTASSASSGSKDAFFDNFDLHDTITPTQATLLATGSITAAGALVKRTNKTFIGSVTGAGVLVKTRVVVRVFTATITAAGAFRKTIPKIFAGSITGSGILRKIPAKKFLATITVTGLLRKSMMKTITGSITATGGAVVVFVGRVFGKPGLVVMNLLQRAEVRIRHRKG